MPETNGVCRTIFQFHQFKLDPAKRLLIGPDGPLSVTARVFDVLEYLVRNSNRLIEKEELLKAVWDDAHVEEANLTVSISALRKLLGEARNEHRFIVTHPKRGYSFVADVQEIPESAIEGDSLAFSPDIASPDAAPDPALQATLREDPRPLSRRIGWGLRLPVATAVCGVLLLLFTIAGREYVSRKSAVQADELSQPALSELCQKGQFCLERRNSDGVEKGLAFFKRAVDANPNDAAAYSGLASCYALSSFYSGLAPNESFPKAREAARTALKLDGNLVDAQAVLALTDWCYGWQEDEAEREFKSIIRSHSGYATGHHWYGLMLASQGRLDEAIAELKKAATLDPTSLVINTNLAQIYFFARNYDLALQQIRQTLDLDPNFAPARELLMEIYTTRGLYQKVLSELSPLPDIQRLRRAFERAGKRGFWEEAMAIGTKYPSGDSFTMPYSWVKAYSQAGDRDKAFQWLDRALAEHDPWLVFINVDPNVDSLRSDSRFGEFVQRLSKQGAVQLRG